MSWFGKLLDFLKAIKSELGYLFSFLAGRSFQKHITTLDAAKNELKTIQKINVQKKIYESDKEAIKKKWSDRRDAFNVKRMREKSDDKQ
ncbi:MAG: hypothetical protein QG556_374 [Pseudomonadota bacterium]|nr:hypothetical protein [Pseudomonadota bacterium]